MTNEILVDARNLECPMPMIMLKKKLKQNRDQKIIFLISNKEKRIEIESFLLANGFIFAVNENEDFLHIIIDCI
jgi:TusA-related sulfurtransferase